MANVSIIKKGNIITDIFHWKPWVYGILIPYYCGVFGFTTYVFGWIGGVIAVTFSFIVAHFLFRMLWDD